MMAALQVLPNTCLLAWGWRRRGLATGAGLLSALAMPPYGIWVVLALTLPALVWLLDGAVEQGNQGTRWRWVAGFSIGWWFGFGYFLAGLWWIGSAFLVDGDRFAWMMPFAVLAMPVGLALFPALALAIAARFWPEGPNRVLVLALVLSGADYVRGHVLTGFPWNIFGYAFSDMLILAQVASVVGVYGLGLLVILILASPAVAFDTNARIQKVMIIGLSSLCLVGTVLFGAIRLIVLEDPQDTATELRIVQPAIPQAEKWLPENRDSIFERYISLSEQALEGDDRDGVERLLIWPESAVPFLLTASPEAMVRIAGVVEGKSSFVTGAIRAEEAGGQTDYFNSVYLFDSDGTVRDAYDKVHLVPFGEYLPLEDLLNSLGLRALVTAPGAFQPGFRGRPLTLASGTSFLPLVCYEAIFPALASAEGPRPDFLLNVTNDAWFGDTAGPYQHVSQSAMRAIEQGLPLVRAANTGVSAIFDAKGRLAGILSINVRGILSGQLPGKLSETIYSKYGDKIFLTMQFLILILILFLRYNRTSRQN
ncbi:apolipoprotein N-acyltransferase [Labrenzia sp. CE80]|uniref:apolipoprotein N-acyltransferase n=1 Tax=Labrenzia sp. CE80 TaxID=1788986 RepID=UPI001AD8D7C8|nr:apolipoprotein N-acyltransferase [Labrenzia sp. CE80]